MFLKGRLQNERLQMEIVERILTKVVGQEITTEEMEQVAGGKMDWCTSVGGYGTVDDESQPYNTHCDFG